MNVTVSASLTLPLPHPLSFALTQIPPHSPPSHAPPHKHTHEWKKHCGVRKFISAVRTGWLVSYSDSASPSLFSCHSQPPTHPTPPSPKYPLTHLTLTHPRTNTHTREKEKKKKKPRGIRKFISAVRTWKMKCIKGGWLVSNSDSASSF